MASPQTAPARAQLPIPRRPCSLAPVHPGPLLLIGALLIAPRFLNEYWTFNVCVGLTLGISCLGLHVLVGWSRQISLMHAGVTGAALYISTDYVARRTDVAYRRAWEQASATARREPGYLEVPTGEFWVAGLLIAVAVAVGLYLIVAVVGYRLGAVYVLVLTFAMQFLIESYIFTRERFVGSHSTMPRPEPWNISTQSDTRYYYVIATALILVLLVLHRLRRSRFGRAIVFAGHQPEAAASAGISPWRFRLVAMVIAGVCAGVSGILQGGLYRNPPGQLQYLSFNSLFYLAVAVLAGGTSLLAVVAVAVTLSLLPVLLDWKLNVYLLGGVGMIVGLMAGPRGIGGAVIDLVAGRWRRPALPPDAFGVSPVEYAAVEVPLDRKRG